MQKCQSPKGGKIYCRKNLQKRILNICPWWHSQSSEDQKSIISGDAGAETDLLMRLFWTHLQLTHLPSLCPLSCFCHFLDVDTILLHLQPLTNHCILFAVQVIPFFTIHVFQIEWSLLSPRNLLIWFVPH